MNKPKRAALVIEEAAGKQIRRLCLEEPYPQSDDIYLTIVFDDETEILIEVGCRPRFGITHLARNPHGELQAVNKPTRGFIRSLVKGMRRSSLVRLRR